MKTDINIAKCLKNNYYNTLLFIKSKVVIFGKKESLLKTPITIDPT